MIAKHGQMLTADRFYVPQQAVAAQIFMINVISDNRDNIIVTELEVFGDCISHLCGYDCSQVCHCKNPVIWDRMSSTCSSGCEGRWTGRYGRCKTGVDDVSHAKFRPMAERSRSQETLRRDTSVTFKDVRVGKVGDQTVKVRENSGKDKAGPPTIEMHKTGAKAKDRITTKVRFDKPTNTKKSSGGSKKSGGGWWGGGSKISETKTKSQSKSSCSGEKKSGGGGWCRRRK